LSKSYNDLIHSITQIHSINYNKLQRYTIPLFHCTNTKLILKYSPEFFLKFLLNLGYQGIGSFSSSSNFNSVMESPQGKKG